MSKLAPTKQPVGRSCAYWLQQTLVQAREDAGLMRVEIAAMLRKDQSSITKFESGPPALPAEIDRYVAAYAQAAGLKDPRELWANALALWQKHGAPPLLDPQAAERAAEKVARTFAEAGQRQQAPAAPSKKPSATPRKRAVG